MWDTTNLWVQGPMKAVDGRLGDESCDGGRQKVLCIGFGRVGVGGRDGVGKRWHLIGTTSSIVLWEVVRM